MAKIECCVVICCAVKCRGVKCYEVERDVRMQIGDVVTIAPYTFRLNSLDEVRGPNYKAVRADVQVLRDDKIIEILQPEKRRYFSSAMAMTEAGIDTGFMRDLYVSLGEPLDKSKSDDWQMGWHEWENDMTRSENVRYI